MTLISKLAMTALVAGGIALNTEATLITGSISFNGNVTPYLNTLGTGTVAPDYTVAHSLVFGASFVSAGATGSFATPNTHVGDLVTMYSPLLVNPPALPVPSTSPLWAVDGFTFTLSSLTEPNVTLFADGTSSMTLQGSGTMSDGNPADNNTGSWLATFTSATGDSGVSFSWNSSSGSSRNVPDGGSSLLLFGLGLTALGAFAKFGKQAVA